MFYHKLIIDIATDQVVAQESFDYTGPVAECGKAPKVKTVAPPPPTAAELETQRLGTFLNQRAVWEMGFDPVTLQKRDKTQEELDDDEINKMITGRLKDELKRGAGEVSPEQEKALGTLYDAEQSKMDEELRRFAIEQGAARGISASDTPLARELFLAKGRGQTELGAARASSKLNFADRERLFAQGMGDWSQQLRQQKFANLAGLQGQTQNAAIGFMNARGGLKPTPVGGGGGGSPIGGIIGGLGSALGGAAVAF